MEELLHTLKKSSGILSVLLNKIIINSNTSITRQSRSYSDQDEQLFKRKQNNQLIFDIEKDIDYLRLEIEKKEQLILQLKNSNSIV